jgi:hypothetical protein
MPKEAIDLNLLISKIENGEISKDLPLLTYRMSDQRDFLVFQNSGMNLLLGKEGNGKTKFLTKVMIDLLRNKDGDAFPMEKVIYIDTERPESQYASTIQHILEHCSLSRNDFLKKFEFFSVSELMPGDIKKILKSMLQGETTKKSIIILDHILPLANNFNDVSETTMIDHLLKALIQLDNIIIASIHMPFNGLTKGLGHLGSSLGRLASFTLEIVASDDGSGFTLTRRKSRISPTKGPQLFLRLDSNGNITDEGLEIINKPGKKTDNEEKEIIQEVLKEFINGSMTTKKQLLSIIQERKQWNSKSSSTYAYFNKHFKELILFNEDGFLFTEQGKEVLNCAE